MYYDVAVEINHINRLPRRAIFADPMEKVAQSYNDRGHSDPFFFRLNRNGHYYDGLNLAPYLNGEWLADIGLIFAGF